MRIWRANWRLNIPVPKFSKAIKAGLVVMNQRTARAADPIHAGDRIEFKVPPPVAPAPATAPAPDIEVLYEDADMIFVNKPPGMAVHPSAGHPHSTLVDALVARFPDLSAVVELDGSWRAGIVHRLDKDTSGVMVVARNSFARAALSGQFKQRTVEKIYVALVAGHLSRDRLTIDQPIGRHQTERKRMSVRSRSGREALSEVQRHPARHLGVGHRREHCGKPSRGAAADRADASDSRASVLGGPSLPGRSFVWATGARPVAAEASGAARVLSGDYPSADGRPDRLVAPIAPDLEQVLAACGIDAGAILGPRCWVREQRVAVTDSAQKGEGRRGQSP